MEMILVVILQAILLGFALMYSGIFVRALVDFFVQRTAGSAVEWGTSLTMTPGFLWTLFYISVQLEDVLSIYIIR